MELAVDWLVVLSHQTSVKPFDAVVLTGNARLVRFVGVREVIAGKAHVRVRGIDQLGPRIALAKLSSGPVTLLTLCFVEPERRKRREVGGDGVRRAGVAPSRMLVLEAGTRGSRLA